MEDNACTRDVLSVLTEPSDGILIGADQNCVLRDDVPLPAWKQVLLIWANGGMAGFPLLEEAIGWHRKHTTALEMLTSGIDHARYHGRVA